MNATLRDQLDWEHEMIYRGVDRYRNQQQAAIEGGRETETSAGSRMLRGYVLQISEHIQNYLDGSLLPRRRRIPQAKLIAGVNTDAMALFTMRHIIAAVFTYSVGKNRKGITNLTHGIGAMIEDEIRFAQFQTSHKDYYDAIVRRLEDGRTKNYRHIHRNMVQGAREKKMKWKEWSQTDRVKIGALCVSLAMEVCDLFEIEIVRKGNKRTNYVVPTQQCLEWVKKHDEMGALACPDRMPCLIPPADWSGAFEGGFWSPRLRDMTPLIKRSSARWRKDGRSKRAEAAVMPKVLSAVNGLQATPWRLNDRVEAVMRDVWQKNLEIGMPRAEPYEIPPCPVKDDETPSDWAEEDPRRRAFMDWKLIAREMHSMEAERQAQNRALVRTMRIAASMKDKERFYYVFTCDFRGRIYCATTGLSPQGTDHSKALLLFGRTEPLGDRGLYWLKVHGANKYGYDKVGYDARVAWVDRQHSLWMAIAADPVGQRSHWGGCDKPWQFLAWCFEYAAATDFGPDYRTSLPIALDGSCNGLQHFSAMLRDPVGAAAVNLSSGDVPEDIYQRVADVATRKLRGLRSLNDEDHAGASNWLSLFASLGDEAMPRKLSKKPVMTLPYGSTRQACTESIFRWLVDTCPKFFSKRTNFRQSIYLTPVLWASISEIVIAAREAMDWVQKCSVILAKENHALEYTSPLGFPVYQASFHYETVKLRTQIAGTMYIRMATDTDVLCARRQRQGSSPNLVHHIDATHLMMVVNACMAEDIDCFSMIHDDFGCHAGRVDAMHRIIRETFVQLHEDTDWLAEFKREHEERHDIKLPEPPAKGSFNIKEVLRSDYFFG